LAEKVGEGCIDKILFFYNEFFFVCFDEYRMVFKKFNIYIILN